MDDEKKNIMLEKDAMGEKKKKSFFVGVGISFSLFVAFWVNMSLIFDYEWLFCVVLEICIVVLSFWLFGRGIYFAFRKKQFCCLLGIICGVTLLPLLFVGACAGIGMFI